MESKGKGKPRPRCSFTPEFKTQIVELCRGGDRSVGQVAKDFGLTETAVRPRIAPWWWLMPVEVSAAGSCRLAENTSPHAASPMNARPDQPEDDRIQCARRQPGQRGEA